MIRVVIADDSPFVREILRDALGRHGDIDVVGEAGDGRRAEELVAHLAPDVVTMDVLMPMVDGLEAIGNIMDRCPTPIIVVADLDEGGARALGALELGAVDVFPKPARGFDETVAAKLVDLIRAASAVTFERQRRRMRLASEVSGGVYEDIGFIGIVASTGGPQTVQRLLRNLPASFPIPCALVQHSSPGFTSALISWLGRSSELEIIAGRHGLVVEPGQVAVAPDEFHMTVRADGAIVLRLGPPHRGHRPSGDELLKSLASSFGTRALGVVCTGMGDDGARGLDAIEAAGGIVVVEDPGTAIIGSMPEASIARTREPVIGSADEIALMLKRITTDPDLP